MKFNSVMISTFAILLTLLSCGKKSKKIKKNKNENINFKSVSMDQLNNICFVSIDSELYCYVKGFGYLDGERDCNSDCDKRFFVKVKGYKQTKFETIKASGETTCALSSNGEVWCWGKWIKGMEKYSKNPSNIQSKVPVIIANKVTGQNLSVVSLNTTSSTLSSGTFVLKTKTKNTIMFKNDKLPKKDIIFEKKLDKIFKQNEVLKISGNNSEFCFVEKKGKIYCWGYGEPIGIGLKTSNEIIPTPFKNVQFKKGISSFELGPDQTCVLENGSNIFIWGEIYWKSQNTFLKPQLFKYPYKIKGISCNGTQICILNNEGNIVCKGQKGKFEINNPLHNSKPGKDNAKTNKFIKLVENGDSICALDSLKKIHCWNLELQKNNNTKVKNSGLKYKIVKKSIKFPVSVKFKDLVSGNNFCAIGTKGKAWCWEINSSQKKSVKLNKKITTVEIKISSNDLIEKIVLHENRGCIIDSKEQIWCWNNLAEKPLIFKSKIHFAHISIGEKHMCGIDKNHKVWCWGNGDEGQLGDGRFNYYRYLEKPIISSSKPIGVKLPENIKAQTIKSGRKHTCITDKSNQLWCWGLNTIKGNLGLNKKDPNKQSIHAVISPNNVKFKDVIRNGYFAFALDSNGTIWEWNSISYKSLAPKKIEFKGNTGFKSLYRNNENHKFCAMKTDGEIYCWGSNKKSLAFGFSEKQMMPIKVELPLKQQIQTISFASKLTCILTKGGSIWCWGRDNRFRSRIPVKIKIRKNIKATVLISNKRNIFFLDKNGNLFRLQIKKNRIDSKKIKLQFLKRKRTR
jgi:alpha-tubulin suppressor-like RCC1 family protein